MEPFYESAKQRAEKVIVVSDIFKQASILRNSSRPISVSVVIGKEAYLLRPLLKDETSILSSKLHCCCTVTDNDWARVLVLLRKDENQPCVDFLKDQISRTHFSGTLVVLGLSSNKSKTGFEWSHRRNDFNNLPYGVHNNGMLSDCIVMPRSKVIGNSIVSRTFADVGSILLNCGTISHKLHYSDLASFQWHRNGYLKLCLGPEAGGSRDVVVCAESTIIDISVQLNMSPKPHKHSIIDVSSITSSTNIISGNSYVCNVANLEDVFLSTMTFIDSASSVVEATLLPESSISNSSVVNKSLLQWKAQISNGAHVYNSILMECAAAETASIVNSSVLGPDSHVGGGETQHTLLGPNTNAHHQSLLIGVIWPLGRGNIGYGANVGSNHTGRIADQECWSGEGLFWGLSTVIKFPVDTTRAPYSIIAAGVNLPPQRIMYPFSLIVESDGINNILPGWVLSNSTYTIVRNETKFSTRRKAKRHAFYTGWKIIRMETIHLCIVAREMLRKVIEKPSYKGDNDIDGIGKNLLTEKARKDGIHIYTETIQRFALYGLLRRVEKYLKSSSKDGLVVKLNNSSSVDTTHKLGENLISSLNAKLEVSIPINPWDKNKVEHSSIEYDQLLFLEFPSFIQSGSFPCIVEPNVIILLQRLVALENKFSDRVSQSKSKDDYRGVKTIPGYLDAHVNFKDDKVVQSSLANARNIQDRVERLQSILGSRSKL